MFISHRWPDRSDKTNVKGLPDEKLVESIYDRLTLYTIEESNRSIDTFLDSRRLKNGMNCVDDFAKALFKSKLIVPMVSRYALERMVQGVHQSDRSDCVLVEWMLSLECYKAKKILGIYPVLIGTHTDDEVKEVDSILPKL